MNHGTSNQCLSEQTDHHMKEQPLFGKDSHWGEVSKAIETLTMNKGIDNGER